MGGEVERGERTTSHAWQSHSPTLAHFKPRSPLSYKTSDTENLESIRENTTLRNGKMQNLSNMEITESKVDSKSRFRVLALDSESKADSQSHQNLESSLLDSRSHGYFLDSQNRLFAQKKGVSPLPALSKPAKRIKRRVFAALCLQPVGSFCAIGESASLFPCLGKNAKNALLHFLNAFF